MAAGAVKPTASFLKDCAKRCREFAAAARDAASAQPWRRLQHQFEAEIARLKRRRTRGR